MDSGLSVDPDELSHYQPTKLDVAITARMLEGLTSMHALSEELGIHVNKLRRYLLDPVRAAWISQKLGAFVANRLSVVSAAMYNQAVNGNVQAARLLFEKYGQMINRTEVVHHRGMDLSKLSNDELDLMLKDKMRATEVIDVTPGQRAEDRDAAPAGGEVASEAGSPASVLPPLP